MPRDPHEATTPYHGPHVVLTRDEARRVDRSLALAPDDEAQAIRAKIATAEGSSPKFLQPHK